MHPEIKMFTVFNCLDTRVFFLFTAANKRKRQNETTIVNGGVMSKVSLTSGRKTVKVQSKLKEKDMSRFSLTAKVADVSKYNLRCNRHISEKMTKKDFIYDIPRLVSCTRKVCNTYIIYFSMVILHFY